jgi:Crescentin protein
MSRFGFLARKARTAALEKVVADARELLLTRAEQIREHDRRNGDLVTERNELQARLSDMQAELLTRESELKEVDHARTIYLERNATLARAFTAKEAALAQAEEANAALNERIGALATAHAADKQAAEQTIEELDAALRREKLERSVVEGALATARKDFPRAMREVKALQRDPPAQAAPARPRAANGRIRIATELAASPGHARRCRFWSIDLPQGRPAPIPASLQPRHPGGGRELFECRTASTATCRLPCGTICPTMRRTSTARRSTTPSPPMPANRIAKGART